MKESKIFRNKTMDVIIGLPMLFMFIGSFYLLSEGRKDSFYLALLMLIAPTIVLSYLLVKTIRNKPLLTFNEQGIFFKKYDRLLLWENISYIKIEEEDLTIKDAPGSGTSGIKKYFTVFEITERKQDGNYGLERNLNVSETNYEAEDLLNLANKYYKEYKK